MPDRDVWSSMKHEWWALTTRREQVDQELRDVACRNVADAEREVALIEGRLERTRIRLKGYEDKVINGRWILSDLDHKIDALNLKWEAEKAKD